jgi:hypothetical protein
MNSVKTNGTNGHRGGACMELPDLRRLNYFFGQMLSVQDFQTEQSFFREKLKLHNRCLHGYGVVCGLLVESVPIPKECDAKEQAEEKDLWEELEKLLAQKAAPAPAPADGQEEAPPDEPSDLDSRIEALRRKLGEFYKTHCREEPHTRVRINCGLALDCEGNEIIVREPLLIDLVQWMSPADYQRVKHGAHEVYISICYCERAVDPVRPVLSGSCGSTPECTYGKWQECFRVIVTVDPPAADCRCETCCESCKECCLLLARIDCFFPGYELHDDHIHNDVRRQMGLYQPTTITGVSWRLGHHYTPQEARELMGTHDRGEYHGKGLEIRFSRPVLASTIHRGVLDTWVIEGGRGRAGNIYNKTGELVDKPKDGLVDRIFFRDTTDETLEPGDRVLVMLRTDFILDQCCRPVDGENTGGRVPLLREYEERHRKHESEHHEEHDREHDHEHDHEHRACCMPPKGYGPWTSGNGTPGGTFESWFFIREQEREHRR